jgi:hypothetical protein
VRLASDLPVKQRLPKVLIALSQECNKPATLDHMWIRRHLIRPVVAMLLLCLGMQTIAFAAPFCQQLETFSQGADLADCHTAAATTGDCCEQQCQQCSLLAATLSSAVAAAGPVPVDTLQLAHIADHFYRHVPPPRFRPPLLTLM